jgi:hypothetical protein
MSTGGADGTTAGSYLAARPHGQGQPGYLFGVPGCTSA